MTQDDDTPLRMTRSDPTRNMARFYVLVLQPTLFGGASVVRTWGRIGTYGREKVETYDEVDAASTACRRIERTKRRRGYG